LRLRVKPWLLGVLAGVVGCGAVASAVAVGSAPAAARRSADIVNFGVSYTGKLTGHKVEDVHLDQGPAQEITDERVKFAGSCRGHWPKDDRCPFLDWSVGGTVTVARTWRQGCTLPIGLDTEQYLKSPNYFFFGPAAGKYFRPSPTWFKVSASPTFGFLGQLRPDPGDPGYYGCNGEFLFIEPNEHTWTDGIVSRDVPGLHIFKTEVEHKDPNDPRSRGFSSYEARLEVTINPGPTWELDQMWEQLQIWLQRAADGVKGLFPPSVSGTGILDANGTLIFQAKTGGLHGFRLPQSAAQTVKLFTISQRLGSGLTRLQIHLTAAGKTALTSLRRPAVVRMTSRLTPASGPATTKSYSVTITPPPTTSSTAAGTISSVTFGGAPDNPSFVVRGTNLGTLPKPDPPGHPSGQNGCPVIAGDSGYDYGTSLYLAVPAKNWSGGRYRPSLNETDCLDLVVTKFTPTEVDFHFGPFYTQNHTQFSLDDGDVVELGVNGAAKTVHVKYGATATS
jgi:hypothetical protein